jgi:hypothetical protein
MALIKGTVARDFRPSVCFSSNNPPPRALTHGLKPFRIWLRIRRENRHHSSFSGVNDTAETLDLILIAGNCEIVNCEIYMTLLKQKNDFASP